MHALSSNFDAPSTPLTGDAAPGATDRSSRPFPFLHRDTRPETTDLVFSFMALTDAAPLIVALAKGYFSEMGLNVTLRRASSWTGLRDEINTGRSHGGHMLFSMPLASACGLLGTKQRPLVVPWIMSRNGQAITLRSKYKGTVAGDAKALRATAAEARDIGRPLAFGHTLRVGTHSLWLRYWLAAGGIHPGNDVALVTVPPFQMVDNMRCARMDGFCAGEPWHARALAENLGFTAITSQEIWPDHPEKALAFTEEFASANPRTVVTVLKALHLAGAWLDDERNHAEAAQLLAGPEYLNCDSNWIASRLGSNLSYGDGRTLTTSLPMTFARRSANRPQRSHAIWVLTQFRRWGLHYGLPDYEGVSTRVIRADFYETALRELGVLDLSPGDRAETFFDGQEFDPASPESYARGFALHNLID